MLYTNCFSPYLVQYTGWRLLSLAGEYTPGVVLFSLIPIPLFFQCKKYEQAIPKETFHDRDYAQYTLSEQPVVSEQRFSHLGR